MEDLDMLADRAGVLQMQIAKAREDQERIAAHILKLEDALKRARLLQIALNGHAHTCIGCGRELEFGDFDCESDSDHPWQLCDTCVAEGRHPELHPGDDGVELVHCPDCGQMEWWSVEEAADHGHCRASALPCSVCEHTE